MTKMKILRLHIKKKWFDMCVQGTKKEEYREIKKHYLQRLVHSFIETPTKEGCSTFTFNVNSIKKFDAVLLINGYDKRSPTALFKCNGIQIGGGSKKLGAVPGKDYFKIQLGELLEYNR